MEEFRHMVNEAIRIGIKKSITSKLRLRNELYPRFKNGLHTSYVNMAVFKAHALLKSYRKAQEESTCETAIRLEKFPHSGFLRLQDI